MIKNERIFLPSERLLPFSQETEEVFRHGYTLGERWGFQKIGSLQILYGITREGSGFYPLERLGIGKLQMQDSIENRTGVLLRRERGEAERTVSWENVFDDLSGDGREVMGLANGAATSAKIPQIVPESLLIGIILQETGSAASLLRRFGVTKERLFSGELENPE